MITQKKDQTNLDRQKRFYANVACINFLLFLTLLSVGAAFVEQDKAKRYFIEWYTPTFNSNATAGPIVQHALTPTSISSIPYLYFIVFPCFVNAAVYLITTALMARKFFERVPRHRANAMYVGGGEDEDDSTSSASDGEEDGEEEEDDRYSRRGPPLSDSSRAVPPLDPNDYHPITLAITRLFPDPVMAALLVCAMSEKDGISLMHTVATTMLLQLCYMVSDGLFVNLYATFPRRGEDGDFFISFNLAHYILVFALFAFWLFAMLSLIHPIRIAKDSGAATPMDLLAAFIIFMIKLGVDSLSFLYTLLQIAYRRRNKKVVPVKNGNKTIRGYLFMHTLDTVLLCVFIPFIHLTLERNYVDGL